MKRNYFSQRPIWQGRQNLKKLIYNSTIRIFACLEKNFFLAEVLRSLERRLHQCSKKTGILSKQEESE